ncbi:MAG: hypothetical protein J7K00_05705 [Candidatus Diapherotrites archaeon]|nr:hypothetical protein [Candidatus Diapherotrites archaeon]
MSSNTNKLVPVLLVLIILAQAVTIYYLTSIMDKSSMALEISERTAVRVLVLDQNQDDGISSLKRDIKEVKEEVREINRLCEGLYSESE